MTRIHALILGAGLSLSSCSVHIEGEQQQRDLAQQLGARYQKPFAERETLPLAAEATLADWLAHAESHNGELEAKWHEWIAAVEEVPQAATQDTTPMLGVEHTLDGGSALDRTGLMLMTDTMANWVLPGRLRDRGLAALARAKVAAAAFTTARFELQAEIAERYVALALADQEIALQERLVAAIAFVSASADARAGAGLGSQRERLDLATQQQRTSAQLQRMRTERRALLVALCAAAGIHADEAFDARPRLPEISSLREQERDAIDCALNHSPALREAKARHDAALMQLAADEWERIPQFSLRSLLMGDGSAMLQPAMTLPFLRNHAIDALLRQREAETAAAAAMLRQTDLDVTAELAAEERALTASADEHDVLSREVAPRLVAITDLAKGEWAAGTGSLDDWLGAEAAQIELQRELARLRAEAAIARAHVQHALGRAETTANRPGDAAPR